MVFNYGQGWDIVFLHVAFVVAEVIVLAAIIVILTEQFCSNVSILAVLKEIVEEKDMRKQILFKSEDTDLVNNFLDTLHHTFHDTSKNSEALTIAATEFLNNPKICYINLLK